MPNTEQKPKLLDGWNWIDRAFFGTAALVVVTAVLGYCLRNTTPRSWTPDVWSAIASWVQAVGSVLGILAAVLTVRYQLKQQRKEAAQRAEESERALRSRGFQLFHSRLVVAHHVAERLQDALQRPKPHWEAVAHMCKTVDRCFNDQPDVPLAPEVITILGVLQTKSATCIAAVDLLLSRPYELKEEATDVFRSAVTRMRREIAAAVQWAGAELTLVLSPQDNANVLRALQIYSEAYMAAEKSI